MKKFCCFLLSFALLVSSFVGMRWIDNSIHAEEAENLVDNGGFERDGEDWYMEPTGRLFTTNNPHSGEKAYFVQPDSNYQLVTKRVAVKKNTDYIFTFWYRGTPGWSQYYVRDAEGVNGSIAKEVFLGNGYEITDWTKVTVTFNSGDFDEYRVGVMTGGPSYPFWIDDICVVEGAAESSEYNVPEGELVDNGGFERNGEDWYMEPTGRLFTTNNPHSGEKAYYIQPDTNYQLVTKKVTVKKNTDYIYSFWYRGTPGWAAYYVRDVGGAKDAVAKEIFFGSGEEVTKWTQVSVSFNSGDYTEYRVGVMTGGPAYPFWIDDISVVEGTASSDEDDQPEGELVDNGGFERNGADWYMEPTGRLFETDNPHSGEKAYFVQPDMNYQLVTKRVAVKKNTDYTYSFWYRGTPGWAQYYVRDAAGVNGSIAKEVFLGSGDEVTDWTKVTVTFNSGNFDEYRVGVMTGGPSYPFWIDDISVVEGTASSDEDDQPEGELVDNGGFEKNGVDWYMEPTGRLFETDNPHGGEKAYFVQPDMNYQLVTKKVAVKKNTDYTFSFWYRGTPGWSQYYVRDAAGAKNAIAKEVFLGSGDEVTEWTQVTVPFNSGDYTEYRVGVMTGGPSYPFWIDDISVVEGIVTPQEDTKPIVENGGFEENGNGWYIEPTGRVYETDNPHGGEKAFYIQPDLSYQLVLRTVKLKPDTDYTLGFWYRGTPGWAQYVVRPTGKASIAKEVFLGSGDEISKWTYFCISFHTGEETSYQVGVMTSGPSYPFWLDDVSVVEGIVAPPEEEIKPIVDNGGFEENGSGWYVEPTGRVFETDNPHGGKKAFYIQPDTNYQLVLRTVKLKPDTDYTLGFWYRGTPGWAQYVVRPTGGASIAKEVFFGSPDEVPHWTYFCISFHTGEGTSYQVGVMTGGPSSPFWLDDVSVVEGIVETPTDPQEPDDPESNVSVPTLVENMPMYIPGTWTKSKYIAPADKNLLTNGDFESDGGVSFDTGVSVSEDAFGVHSGKKGAIFKTTGEKTSVCLMNVEKNTDYLFGMWIRNKPYSADNTNALNWGISAPGSKELALKKAFPFGDGTWHLVEYSFNSQDNEQVALNIIGQDTTSLYFDDMFLCKTSDMVRYIAPEEALASATAVSGVPTLTGCDEKDNLFGNYDLSQTKDTFWSNANGSVWGKQLTVEDTGSETYGKALHYRVGKTRTGNDRLTGAYYIRRVAVEPNTEYTFSAQYSLVSPSAETVAGTTFFGLIDTNREVPTDIHTFQMDQSVYLENHAWQTAAVTFNSGDYHEIAFVLLDCGGEFYLDDLRLFKTENAKNPEEKKDDFSVKKLTSKNYAVQNGIVSGVPEKTTADKLIGAFDNSKYLALYDAQGNRVSGDTPAATGMELRLMNGPVIIDRALISVRGDVDGNGTADEKDVQKIHAMLTGEEKLNGTALQAADYNGNGTVDIYDTLHKASVPKSGGSMSASVVPPENLTANSPFEVCLRVKGGVSAISGSIRYDKAHMILRDASLCVESPWLLTYSFDENEVLFAITNCGGAALPTEANLLKLTFETDQVGGGLPAVTFTNLKLTDGSSISTPADAAWTYSEPKKAPEKAPSSSGQQQSDAPEQQVTTIVTTGLDEADNNYLESLVVEEAEISPEFDPENKNYNADVPFEVKQVTVTAVPQNKRATVTVSDTELPFVGKNIVKVVVHSESGLKRTYKVYITRRDKTRSGQGNASSFPWLWVVIAAGTVVLAGGIFLLIFFKKKKRKEEKD